MRRSPVIAIALSLALVAIGVLAAQHRKNGVSDFNKLLAQDCELAARSRQYAENRSPILAVELRWQQWRLEAAFKKFLQTHPDHARAMVVYANYLYDQGHATEAVEWWKRAIVTAPRLAVAYNNLANHYTECGLAAEALRLYQKAVEIEPDTAMYRYNWAMTCSMFRNETKKVYGWNTEDIFLHSFEQFRRARDLAANDFSYSRAYAEEFFWAEMAFKPNWSEAYDAWRFCLNQPLDERQRQHVFGQLALVSMRLNRLDEARMWIEKMTRSEIQDFRRLRERKLAQLLASNSEAGQGRTVSVPSIDGGGK